MDFPGYRRIIERRHWIGSGVVIGLITTCIVLGNRVQALERDAATSRSIAEIARLKVERHDECFEAMRATIADVRMLRDLADIKTARPSK